MAGGLHSLLSRDGGKYWRYKYRFADKDRTMPFGMCPDVFANMARELHTGSRSWPAVMECWRRTGATAAVRAGADE